VHGAGFLLTLTGYLSILAWVMIWTPLVESMAQRAVLAWALDGLAPQWAGEVNERWHTPIPAILVAFLMGESFMLLFAFIPSFRTIVLLIPLYFGLAVTMAVGTFFPFVRKEFFDQSMATAKVAGIPVMSIVCGISTVLLLIYSFVLWNDPVAAGTDQRPLIVCAAMIVGIAIYYFALRAYRRRRGEDISVIFKRIPVE
jgi:amino acid transporter